MSSITEEKDLTKYYSKFGPVERVQIIYDRGSKRSRGFGFIYFENVDDAVEAQKKTNGMEFDGRVVRVDFSFTKSGHGSSRFDQERERKRSSSKSPEEKRRRLSTSPHNSKAASKSPLEHD